MINKNPAKLQEVVQVGQRQMIKSRSPGTTNLDKREKQEEEMTSNRLMLKSSSRISKELQVAQSFATNGKAKKAKTRHSVSPWIQIKSMDWSNSL